jgi:NTP pyrophosphatase (non-canonical NTP hydrolase)
MMNLRQLQSDSKVWRQHNFPIEHRTAQLQVLGVCEEAGELSHSVLKMVQGIRGSEAHHLEKAKDAVGDIIICLAGVCDALDLDLEDCVLTAWREVEARDWSKNKGTGVASDSEALEKAKRALTSEQEGFTGRPIRDNPQA